MTTLGIRLSVISNGSVRQRCSGEDRNVATLLLFAVCFTRVHLATLLPMAWHRVPGTRSQNSRGRFPDCSHLQLQTASCR